MGLIRVARRAGSQVASNAAAAAHIENHRLAFARNGSPQWTNGFART